MRYLTGWFIFILFLMVIARTRAGHLLINYVLWLSIVLLVVTNYQAIIGLLNPSSQVQESIGQAVKAG